MKIPAPHLLAAPLLLAPLPAAAQLLSQDSFTAYPTGVELPGQNPTLSGYSGAWTDVAFGDAEPAVSAGSLLYAGAGYTAGSGGKVGKGSDTAGIGAANSGRVERLLDSTLAVDDTTTGRIVYLSWLFQTGNQNTAANPNTYQTLALWNGTGATDGLRDFEAGIAAGDFGTPNFAFRVDNNTAGQGNLNVAPDNGVHLFVVKFVLTDVPLEDSITVWLDPGLGAGEPTGGVTLTGRDLAFDRLALSDYASNSSAWDEIRWGSSFDSVTTGPVFPVVPVIELQPQNQEGFVSRPLTLTAGITGTPAPTFQWQKSADGVSGWANVPGAQSASYAIASPTLADGGFYRIIATNANGTATSDAASLTLTYPRPVITDAPDPVLAEEGSNASLTVVATGIGTLTYQWFKDGEPLPGATAATLLLTNVRESDEGSYTVTITDPAATTTNLPAETTDSLPVTVEVFPRVSGLISHDPFRSEDGYFVGELPGQNGTVSGYRDFWSDVDFGDAEPAVTETSLTYGDRFYLGSSGDRIAVAADSTGGEITAANSGRVFRLLEPALAATDATATVRYLSFLFRSGQETGSTTYQTLHLNAGNGDANRNFDLGLTNNGGQPGTAYTFGLDGTYTSTGRTADTNVHLFVVKFTLSATPGSDSATVWTDPVLGQEDPAGGVTVTGANLTWDRLGFSDYDGNAAAWDEIRWGTTFNSVTLNPNPADDYAAWIARFPAVGALTGFSQDADGDGFPNGVENIFGTNPAQPSPGLTALAKAGSTLTFQHPQAGPPASNVTVSYRWSTGLDGWTNSGATVGGTTVTLVPALNTPANGTTTVTAEITGIMPPRLFLQVQAQQSAAP